MALYARLENPCKTCGNLSVMLSSVPKCTALLCLLVSLTSNTVDMFVCLPRFMCTTIKRV